MSRRRMIATEPDWIRSSIEKYRGWIESMLGVDIDKSIVMHVSNNFTSLAARSIFSEVPVANLKQGPDENLREQVTALEYPGGIPPLMRAKSVNNHHRSFAERSSVWEISWGDAPVAIRFKGLRGAVVVFDLPFYSEHDGTRWTDILVCRQDEIAAVMELAKQSNAQQDGALLSNGMGSCEVKKTSWDDLVLDSTVLQLVKNDYESFFAREQWFRDLNLPFRRGYLFHGPPGNGKTSVIRAMLSRPGMRGFTLNFFGPDTDDDDLQHMFERAADYAPSMVIMEDIDRAFPKNQASGVRSKISLQQLLNCLDGLGTQDGVVVAATANEPTALDPAILRRPGRFDRVVVFPNPTAELRLQYLRKLKCQFSETDLKSTIEQSDSFSFAQMREAYILAGQRAFELQAELEPSDIQYAVRVLRLGFSAVSKRGDAVGFRVAQSGVSECTSVNRAEPAGVSLREEANSRAAMLFGGL